MSTLFTAHVAALENVRVVIELTVAHPDAGPVKGDLVFAMRLLAERAIEETYDGTTVRGPLGDEVRFGEAESTSWCEANASRFIASVTVGALPPPGVEGWRYVDGATVPYEIVVTDPRWLEHLAAGESWDSVAYS